MGVAELQSDSAPNRILLVVLGFLWLAPAVPVYDIVATTLGIAKVFVDEADENALFKAPVPGKQDNRFFQILAIALKAFSRVVK